MDPPAGTPPLCPLASQRDVRSTAIRHFALQVSVLPIYGHLLSLRRIGTPIESLLLVLGYFLNPLFPLLLFIRQLLLTGLRRAFGPVNFAATALGMHVEVHGQGNIQSLELGIMEQGDGGTSVATGAERVGGEGEGKRDGTWIARVVVIAAITVQCFGSVLLGVRRRNHNAAIKADNWTLVMALSGLFILFQSAWILLLNQPSPRSRSRYADADGAQRSLFHYTFDIVLFLISWIVAVSKWGFNAENNMAKVFAYAEAGLVISTVSILYLNRRERTESEAMWIFGTGFALLWLVGCGWAYVYLVEDDIRNQLGLADGSWPEDKACPLLWKDWLGDGILAF